MKRRSVTWWGKEDLFCLSHDERKRLTEALAQSERQSQELIATIEKYVIRHLDVTTKKAVEGTVHLRIKRVLEKLLLAQGEFFAASVTADVGGELRSLASPDIRSFLINDLADNPVSKDKLDTIDLCERVILDILIGPTEEIRRGLRSLADAYTLFAFLRETPDVQSAVVKMFSQGDIWLDTSIVLPIFADGLQIPETQKFSILVRTAVEAGLRLHITPGVLQEIERHFNICLAYSGSQAGTWVGRVPFLYTAYALSGRPLTGFPQWAEIFRGDVRPEDDIALYLEEVFQIAVDDLDQEVRAADEELRFAAERLWHEVHEKRRTGGARDVDEITANRLVLHDVENMVGIIYRQSQEHRASPFGYSNWVVTLDRSAPEVYKALKSECSDLVRSSPLMSAYFLLNYLAFGPIRQRVSKSTEAGLPVFFGSGLVPVMPNELLEIAQRVRTECRDLDESIIRRRVRDELDKARLRIGPVAIGGLDDIERAYGGMTAAVVRRPVRP
jgi:hypothetical protein